MGIGVYTLQVALKIVCEFWRNTLDTGVFSKFTPYFKVNRVYVGETSRAMNVRLKDWGWDHSHFSQWSHKIILITASHNNVKGIGWEQHLWNKKDHRSHQDQDPPPNLEQRLVLWAGGHLRLPTCENIHAFYTFSLSWIVYMFNGSDLPGFKVLKERITYVNSFFFLLLLSLFVCLSRTKN